MIERKKATIMSASTEIVSTGNAGMGIAFETLGLQILTRSNAEYPLRVLNRPCQNANRPKDSSKLFSFPVRLLRTVEEISELTNNTYGVPIFDNFPLVDAILQPNTRFNFTISDTHKGAVEQLTNIRSRLRGKLEEHRFVVVTKGNNVTVFQFMSDLASISQFFTTIEHRL